MSIKYIFAALRCDTGSTYSKMVLLKLADNSNDEGFCWPKIKTISEEGLMSQSAVKSNLQKLANAGLITVQHRSIDGVSLSNVYTLNYDAIIASEVKHEDENRYGGVGQQKTPVGQQKTPVGQQVTTEPVNEPVKEPVNPIMVSEPELVLSPKPPALPNRFDEFWSVYPKKAGKQAAIRRWKDAVKSGVDPQEIIDGAARYAASCIGKPRQYVKNPEGWLHDGRWSDVISKADGMSEIDIGAAVATERAKRGLNWYD